MDYTVQMLESHHTLVKTFNDTILERVNVESDFIMACMEGLDVVMEATDNKTSIFKKVMDFLTRIKDLFLEKMRKMTDFSGRWLQKNKEKLYSLDYSGLSVDILPYWNTSTSRMVSEVKKINTTVFNNMDKQSVDVDALFKQYEDDSGSLAGGLKNYFRFGKANTEVKPVSLKGGTLKSKVTGEFIPYCEKYKTVGASVTQMMNNADGQLRRLDQDIKRQTKVEATKESLLLFTDTTFHDLGIVTEAEVPVVKKDNTPEKPQTTQKEEVKPGQSKVVNNSPTSTKDKSVNELTHMRKLVQVYQIAVSAMMTISEERYRAYWSTLKQLVGENKSKELKEEK